MGLFVLGPGKPPPDRSGGAPIAEIGNLKLGDRVTRYKQEGTIWFFRIFPADEWRPKTEAYAFIAEDNGGLGVMKLEVTE